MNNEVLMCCRFLVDVAAKDSNKMSPMGLAIVFGPNLFRLVKVNTLLIQTVVIFL